MFIYLDNAATTRVSDTALSAMLPYFQEQYGNPSSLYAFGQEAKEALERARETVAGLLNCEAREIIFTSGGSEADNQAIRSAAAIGARAGKRHIISTAFEHHAVLHTLSKLEKEGFEVTLLDVHENGVVRPEELVSAIRPDTCLVTPFLPAESASQEMQGRWLRLPAGSMPAPNSVSPLGFAS